MDTPESGYREKSTMENRVTTFHSWSIVYPTAEYMLESTYAKRPKMERMSAIPSRMHVVRDIWEEEIKHSTHHYFPHILPFDTQ